MFDMEPHILANGMQHEQHKTGFLWVVKYIEE